MGKSILNNCAVIEIEGIFPEHLLMGDLKLPVHDTFHFLVKEKNGWSLYQKMERSLDEKEIVMLDAHLKEHDWAESAVSKGDVLIISIEDKLKAAIDAVNNMPGARINPNFLQKGSNIFISVEFNDSCRKQISGLVLDFVSDPEHPERSLVFYGKHEYPLPRLLKFYDRGGSDEGFLLIQTVWNFDEKTREEENEGVFMNGGVFQPKYFEESGKVNIVSRLEQSKVLGNAEYQWVDEEHKIAEFSFSSHFMEDFTINVIEHYAGPLFSRMISKDGKLISYYVVEKSTKDEFFRTVSKHWSMPVRKDHTNSIELIEDLEYVPSYLSTA